MFIEGNIHVKVMDQLGEDELKLISIISRLIKTNRIADVQVIGGLISVKIPSIADTWESTAEKLIEKGIIKFEIKNNTKTFFFTQEGEVFSEKAYEHDLLTKYFYDEYYKAAEESKAHSEFCEIVYGANMCQHGMADIKQISKLIELLDANKGSNILEIGCGSGYITEYISDNTGANITGIDISPVSIEMAKKRTRDKGNKLSFEAMNIYELSFSENSFDTIIAIDSLFFVNPFEDVVERMLNMLKPEGVMYVFYIYPPDIEKLRFSEELKRLNICYETIDLTKENYEHWKLKENTLISLKHKFDEEGSSFLYENRMAECSGNLCDFKRYLYIVNK